MLQGLPDGPGCGNAYELGRHQRTGALLGIDQKLLDGRLRLGIETREQVGTARLLKVLENIGDTVGRHAAQQRKHTISWHRFDNLRRIGKNWVIENGNREFDGQVEQHCHRDFGVLIVQRFGDVGRPFLGQPRRKLGRIDHLLGFYGFAHGLPLAQFGIRPRTWRRPGTSPAEVSEADHRA